jgi:hypothetical protein
VPYSATYALYRVDSEGAAPVPVAAAAVERGRKIGFVPQPDGTVVAYAAGEKYPLTAARYTWEVTSDTARLWKVGLAQEAGDWSEKVISTTATAVTSLATITLMAGGVILYALASSGTVH